MNTALANPKTTLLGVLTIVGGLVNAALDYMQGRPVNTTILLTTISTGIALIMAKDGSTHSTRSQGLLPDRGGSPNTRHLRRTPETESRSAKAIP